MKISGIEVYGMILFFGTALLFKLAGMNEQFVLFIAIFSLLMALFITTLLFSFIKPIYLSYKEKPIDDCANQEKEPSIKKVFYNEK